MRKLFFLIFALLPAVFVSAQNLTGIFPNAGLQNETLIVSISGQNTHFAQASNTSVWFKQGTNTLLFPTSISVYNNLVLEVEVQIPQNQPTGLYHVKVNNSIDGTMNLFNGFQIDPDPYAPVLNQPTPTMAYQSSVIPVMISGQNTNFGQGTSTTEAWLSKDTLKIYPSMFNILDTENILSQFPVVFNQDTGNYQLNVYNSIDGFLTADNFQIQQNPNPPIIEDVNPPSAFADTILTVTVSGFQTNFGQGTSTTSLWMEKNFNLLSPLDVQVTHSDTLVASFELPAGQETGNYTVYTHDDIDGILQYNSFEVLADTLSLTEADAGELIFYPNPAADFVFIELPGSVSGEVLIQLFDLNGKLVIHKKMESESGYTIPIHSLEAGFYTLSLLNNKQHFQKKIIIAH